MEHQPLVAWLALVGLGAFHGINPGMGWLFAVALGMQEKRRAAVYAALLPLAAGHALAVLAAVAAAVVVGAVMPLDTVRWILAAVLLSLGISASSGTGIRGERE
jgi:threonine/homoserine/homoserine lactone efflux protein